MACLSEEQIDRIRNDLKDRNESRSFLFEEWVDHICCDVESLMNKGMSFEESCRKVAGETGGTDIRSAQREVQQFLNHPYVGIKKLLLMAFLIFAAGWVINLQGESNWIGLVSFVILSLVYLRIAVDFLRKRFVQGINRLLSAFGFLSFAGTLAGILLIFLHRNYGVNTNGHGVDLTVFAWFFFSLACFIYYVRERRSAIEKQELQRHSWFIALAAFNLLLSGLSVASFPLYQHVQAYLFFLILFILAFNVLAIGILLLTRSMKNTLILSLVIGSFMIVFIHSPFRSKLPGGKPKLHEITLQYTIKKKQAPEILYISMFYDRFPDKPITLPLIHTGTGRFTICIPSYAYRGFLYYKIRTDSSDAAEFFRTGLHPDSIRLYIPAKTVYELK
jgi:hypothetical protein